LALLSVPPPRDEVPERPPVIQLYWINLPDGAHLPVPRTACSETCTNEPMQEFESALREARRRIWILDPHFDVWCGVAPILGALTEARPGRDLRILTGRKERQGILRFMGELRVFCITAKNVHSLKPDMVHDRFALVDRDLWHFGSTVGGGYHLLSAASCGWYERASDLGRVYESLWRQAEGK